jgi:hypothetical protein
MDPHTEAAELPYDPAESVATEVNGEIAYYPQPKKNKGPIEDARLADPKQPGGPSDYSDPNPVDPEHVMNMMRSNFPEEAVQWVMRARWIGPVQVPWERVDIDDIDSWAASHQGDAVARFAKDIKAGSGHTNPCVLVQEPTGNKAFIVDGHHRALAYHKLGQPVLAYVGMIDAKDRTAALETHTKQVHQGNDSGNKLCMNR